MTTPRIEDDAQAAMLDYIEEMTGDELRRHLRDAYGINNAKEQEIQMLHRLRVETQAQLAAKDARIADLEAAIERIADDYNPESGDEGLALEEMRFALKGLLSELEAAQRWIPVEERLPDSVEIVIVFVCAGDMQEVHLASHTPGGWNFAQSYGWHEPGATITHWRPLPSLP
jgi:hypothetical protein